MAREVGVPRVRVDQVSPDTVTGHRQVDAERLDRGVGVGKLGQVAVGLCPRLVTGRPEAPDLHVEVAPGSQSSHELGHVDARSPVDRRWVLLAEDVDAHESSLAANALIPG